MKLVSKAFFGEGKLEPKTLVEGAYLALRNDIIRGVYTASSKLKVDHLKDVYQVSGGTLREALALLVADSLVYAEGQKGFFVSPRSIKDVKEITQLRVNLEIQALTESIQNGDDKWEADVMAAYHRLALAERKLALEDIEQRNAQFFSWEERNAEFHASLVSACQSKWLLQFIGILYQQMTGVGNELLCALQGFRAKTWYMMQQQVRPFCGECHRHVLVEWLYKKEGILPSFGCWRTNAQRAGD